MRCSSLASSSTKKVRLAGSNSRLVILASRPCVANTLLQSVEEAPGSSHRAFRGTRNAKLSLRYDVDENRAALFAAALVDGSLRRGVRIEAERAARTDVVFGMRVGNAAGEIFMVNRRRDAEIVGRRVSFN